MAHREIRIYNKDILLFKELNGKYIPDRPQSDLGIYGNFLLKTYIIYKIASKGMKYCIKSKKTFIQVLAFFHCFALSDSDK